ncbi:MAG TPA: DUF6049 family protein [Candidatus Nanopelagicaceae bacterium]|nr:DUF6049 family protein [Candidatus Nanopelagicaceae bacterium]
MKSIRRLGAHLTFFLLALTGLFFGSPAPSLAASTNGVNVVITNINNHLGATASRDLIDVSVSITSPITVSNWSLQILSSDQVFSSRSQIAAFAANSKASGAPLVTRMGATSIDPLVPATASISLTGSDAMVRDLGVHGFWLQLVINGRAVKSIPFFSYGSGGSSVQPTPIVWMLPLVEPPHRDLLGNFIDDDLAKSLAPDGRLGQILNFGSGPLTTWLIDPYLVESVAAMADGYTYGQGKPGSGQDVAIAWLTHLRSAVANSQVIALPYGDPDLTTLAKSDLKYNLTRSISEGASRLSALLQQPVSNVAAWPLGGLIDKSTKSLIENNSANTFLISSASVVNTQTATGSSNLGSKTSQSRLQYDATLARQLVDLTPLSANRLSAELTMITSERPSIPRAQILLPPRLWSPNSETMATIDSVVPIREISLDQLRNSPVTSGNTLKISGLSALNDGEVSALQLVNNNLSLFASASQIGSWSVRNEILRSSVLLSTSWHGRNLQASQYAQSAVAASESIVRQIRVLPGSYTLTTLHQKLPITITNDSANPATVVLRVIPTTFRILQPAYIQVSLEAKSKTQVMVPIDAVTSGDLTLVASLAAPNGETLGDVSELTLSIRTVPAIANWIMEGAAIALVIGSAIQITGRLRRRKKLKLEQESLVIDEL